MTTKILVHIIKINTGILVRYILSRKKDNHNAPCFLACDSLNYPDLHISAIYFCPLRITGMLIKQSGYGKQRRVHINIIYLIVSMNAAHMSIQAAQFSEHATTLLTGERLASFDLCMHSLQHSHAHIYSHT